MSENINAANKHIDNWLSVSRQTMKDTLRNSDDTVDIEKLVMKKKLKAFLCIKTIDLKKKILLKNESPFVKQLLDLTTPATVKTFYILD